MRAARADRDALRAVRAVRRARGDRLSAGDVSYRIYLAVMLAIIVVAPAVRAGILAWAPAIPETAAHPAGVAAALTLSTAGLALLGSRAGPARAGLPQLDLLFTAALPRARLLGPSLGRWFAAGASVGAAIGGMAAVALALAAANGLASGASLELGIIAALVGAGAALGVLGVGALLLGQRGPRVRGGVALGLAALAAAQLAAAGRGVGALPDPWSASAALLERAASGSAGDALPVSLILLPALAALAVLCGALPLATRLSRERLRAQAVNWDAASALALTGDPTAALARFGEPVRHGRRLILRPARGLGGTILRRDLLGLVRAPGRSLAGLGGMLAAGALWGSALAGGGSPLRAALLGAAATVVAALAAQPWCRGLVAAAAGVGSPALLPSGPGALMARHALLPALAATLALAAGALLVCAGVGVGVVADPGAGSGPAEAAGVGALLTAPVLAAAVVLLRVAAALKGTIPLRLLAPVPTPLGDVSAVNVFIWTIDGPVVALLVGAALGASWGAALAAPQVAGPVLAGSGVSLVLLAALIGWSASRLRPSRPSGGA